MRYRRAVENSGIGIALIGTDGQWLEVNRKVCEIVGYSQEELLQLTFQDVTHPEDLQKDLDLLNEVSSGVRETYQMDKRYIRKGGSHIWVRLTVACVRHTDRKVAYFISQIQDITEEKARIEDLEHFVHVTAHQLKQAPRSIAILTETLMSEWEYDEESLRLLRLIHEDAIGMNEVVQGLHALVTLKSTSMSPGAYLCVNLAATLRQIKESRFPTLVVHSLPKVATSEEMVTQLFANLVENAFKYSGDNAKVEVGCESYKDNYALLYVKDNGRGIWRKGAHEKVFELFRRYATDVSGTGIGLALCKNIVEKHGGRIWVESEGKGLGSIFKFTLPLCEVQGNAKS